MNNDMAFYFHVMIAAVVGALIVPFMLPVLGANPYQTKGCFVTLVLGAIVAFVLALKER